MSDEQQATEPVEQDNIVVTTDDSPLASEAPVEEVADKPVEDSQAKAADAEDVSGDGDDSAAGGERKPRKNRLQARIDKVVREREEERRQREALEAELEAIRSEKAAAVKEREPVVAPKEEDFESFDKYLDALDEFETKKEEMIRERQEARKAKPSEPAEVPEGYELTPSQKTAYGRIKERVEIADKPDDFDEVALGKYPVTGEMLEAIAECEKPEAVLYHLGSHREMAAEIAGMSPIAQAFEIARIAGHVTTPKKPKNLTKAPEPISPVGKSSGVIRKTYEEQDFREFEKTRAAEEETRKRTGGGW